MRSKILVPKIIVPAAGYGVRLGSPAAKEMLPLAAGMPLIRTPLDIAKRNEWPIHVITRREKTELVSYLEGHHIPTQLVDKTREWPETVMASEPYWSEWNVLFLPDIQFSPVEALNKLWDRIILQTEIETVITNAVGESQEEILTCYLGALTFAVENQSVWGCVQEIASGDWQFAEKPAVGGPGEAWGFLFFHRNIGRKFFSRLLESSFDHSWKSYQGRVETLKLDSFNDLTRD